MSRSAALQSTNWKRPFFTAEPRASCKSRWTRSIVLAGKLDKETVSRLTRPELSPIETLAHALKVAAPQIARNRGDRCATIMGGVCTHTHRSGHALHVERWPFLCPRRDCPALRRWSRGQDWGAVVLDRRLVAVRARPASPSRHRLVARESLSPKGFLAFSCCSV